MTDDVINYVIGQLRGACWEEEAVAIETLVKQRDDLQRDQTYSYIGKDMKRWLARDLEDAKDTAEAKLQKALEHLKFCLMRLDELVLESGRSIEYGEEDPFRMGEWFEPLELMAIEEARTVLVDMKDN